MKATSTTCGSVLVPPGVIRSIEERDGASPRPGALDYTDVLERTVARTGPSELRLFDGGTVIVPKVVADYAEATLLRAPR